MRHEIINFSFKIVKVTSFEIFIILKKKTGHLPGQHVELTQKLATETIAPQS